MPIHVVKSGECFSVVAQRYGFADYKILYDHPDNAELRQKRPNPNVIHPGDRIVVPDRTPKTADVAVGQTHRFVAKMPKKVLRVVLQDHEGKPLANEACVVRVDGGEAIELTTDGNGKLEHPVSIRNKEATVRIAGRLLRLRFGALNPITDAADGGVSGVKGRLKNLGYDVTSTSDALDDATRATLSLFQHDHDLEVTGKLDDTTIQKIAALHGS